MKRFSRVMLCFTLGLLIQGGIYYYLERVYLVPASDFEVTSGQANEAKKGDFPEIKGEGKAYYSSKKDYMAMVAEQSVKIYKAGKPNDVVTIDLKGMNVSFFEWLPDRDLAIMGLYKSNGRVILAQFNPESPDHEIDTAIEDLPRGSKIVDVAYSTATNVVYMKVRVEENGYRVYRTDANYDTRRVYMQASNIGRIGVFYDEDAFFYDNVRTGDVYTFNGVESSWRVINPPGRYRFIGLSQDKEIYIAHVNNENKVIGVSRGKLGVGFKEILAFDSPRDLDNLTVDSVKKEVAEKGESQGTSISKDKKKQ